MLTLQEAKVRAKEVRLLVLDVDGVLTDGRLYFLPTGEELKVFHVQDGFGVKRLRDANINCAIISGRGSPIVQRRAEELGIKWVFQNCKNKMDIFNQLLQETQFAAAQIACIGDDMPDSEILQACGLGVAVANAQNALIQYADWCTQAKGGEGAVRELCDFILAAQM